MSTYFLGNGQVVLGTLKLSNKLFKRTLPRATPRGKLRLRWHGSVRIFDRLKKLYGTLPSFGTVRNFHSV